MLTIFTPTYNRKNLLFNLYQSLCKQRNRNFVWMIVDDGSTDETEKDVSDWQNENVLQILYFFKENGGKHTAHNYAVEKCNTEFFICVDSDDRLSEDAVNIIYECCDRVKNLVNIAGVIFPSWDGKKEIKYPKISRFCSIRNLYDKLGYRGETALVFKTAVLKKYLFPVFENEKFQLESVIYDAISKEYKMLLDHRLFYEILYQQDGYTNNILELLKANPKGLSFDIHQRINLTDGFWNKLRQYARYVMWCMLLKFENPFKDGENKCLVILSLPWALALYIKQMIVN